MPFLPHFGRSSAIGRPVMPILPGVLRIRLTSSLAFIVACALAVCAPAHASQQAAKAAGPDNNLVVGYSSWDDDYLYLAVQVNKPQVVGKNAAAFSSPLEDDSVIVSIQTDDDHKATRRTAHTVIFAASGVGGAQLYLGADGHRLFNGIGDIDTQLDAINKSTADPTTQENKRTALLASIVKFSVSQQGAPRSDGSHAPGYTVEAAIPWSDLGGKPAAGTRMGFNVVAKSISAGSPPIQSLSPDVRSEADTENPAEWGELQLSNTAGASSSSAVVCARVLANKPVIDGDVSAGEWNVLSSLRFGGANEFNSAAEAATATRAARARPDFTPRPQLPAVPLPVRAAASPLPPHRPQALPPAVMALYDCSYQADPRQPVPTANVLRSDGATALALHPFDGTGAWFSYTRADWHRRQLAEMRRAGIDVALVVYPVLPRERRIRDGALEALVSALRALADAGEDYPQVALCLDTSHLADATIGVDDLYDAVLDFYEHVPARFRYSVPLTAENGGRLGALAAFTSAAPLQSLGSSVVGALRARFAAEFPGCDLVTAAPLIEPAVSGIDAWISCPGSAGFGVSSDGWIKAGYVRGGTSQTLAPTHAVAASTAGPAVQLAANDTAAHAPAAYRWTMDGYRSDWASLTQARPSWVVLDSWSNFAVGTAVAPSMERGYTAEDVTHESTRIFSGAERLAARILSLDAPGTMAPGETAAVRVRAENTGIIGWSPTPSPDEVTVAWTYRWSRGGSPVAAGSAAPLTGALMPGRAADAMLQVSAVGSGGAPLPEGDYSLEIGAALAEKRGAGEWVGGGPMVTVPVHVRGGGAPYDATLIATDLPASAENGSVYDVTVTLRNDGARPWRAADGAFVALRLYTSSPAAGEMLSTAGSTVALSADVAPGAETTVRLIAPLTDPEGQPLSISADTTLTARFEVAADGKASAGCLTSPLAIRVVPFDFGVRFTADTTPPQLPAQHRLPVQLSLENVGPQTWKKDSVRVGYHWYYLDGSEYLFDDETTPLPQDVAPGARVNNLLTWVTAPPYDGAYFLVWDVKFGEAWASTTAGSRPFDESVRQIQVVDGRLTFPDLTHDFNQVGVEDRDTPSAASFNDVGRALPASDVPPYATADTVPAAMWLPGVPGGPDSPKRISFLWGPKDGTHKDVIVCDGQQIELGKQSAECRVLHLLAASTGKPVAAAIKLYFQEPTSRSEDLYTIQVNPWDAAQPLRETVAWRCPETLVGTEVHPGDVALYDYAIPVHEPRKLVAIGLPSAPDVKIVAITLER